MTETLPLFANVTIVSTDPLVVRNDGTATIRTRTYGTPEYRLIAQVVDERERVLEDRWLALPRDLHPGETATLDFTPRTTGTLRLYQALQDVPIVRLERVR